MADRSLQIRPITGALGAEIAEIDLSADLMTARSRRPGVPGSTI
jgi:hypothetical protein